jgi:hypothetical protein
MRSFSKIKYVFTNKVWQHSGPGGWFFISIPKEISSDIRELHRSEEEGWGRLKAIAKINQLDWETAIWFDSKNQEYLLPLKSKIRKDLGIQIGNDVTVEIFI